MIIGRLRRRKRERAGGQRPYVVQDVVHRHRLPPSWPLPTSQSPYGAEASDAPATAPEIMPVYQTVYGLVGTPACTGAPWDDAGCGKDLTAAEASEDESGLAA